MTPLVNGENCLFSIITKGFSKNKTVFKLCGNMRKCMLIDLFMVFNAIFIIISVTFCQPCFPWVPFASTLHKMHNILSKPLAGFPHNNYQSNGQRREKNESCVAITIINPLIKHWPSWGSNQQPHVLKWDACNLLVVIKYFDFQGCSSSGLFGKGAMTLRKKKTL